MNRTGRRLGRTALGAGALGLLLAARAADGLEVDDRFPGVGTTLPDGSAKLYPDPKLWAFSFWPGTQWPDSYGDGTNWLGGNGECQTYVTPLAALSKSLPAGAWYDPFRIDGDGLHVRAALLDPRQQQAYRVGGYRRFGSGMLLSRFSFRYGTVRMVARLPAADGSWPALWLLPASHRWPPEIDIFEAMPWAAHRQQIHSGIILAKGETGGLGRWFDVGADPTAGFHEYSLAWTPAQTTMRFDGRIVWQAATPPSLDQDMDLLVTYAVGGKWPFNELQVPPADGLDPARLEAGADRIQAGYPAEMTIREISVTSP